MKSNQNGSIDILLAPLILVTLFFFGAVGFGYWAYQERSDYKDHSDQKAAIAVDEAKKALSIKKDKEFAEKEKQPLRAYNGPSEFGSVEINYPKTWSAYVADDGNNSGEPVDGYFHPKTVPSVEDETNAFALRLQVVQQSYSEILSSFSDKVENKEVRVKAFAAKNVPSVVGVRIDGKITDEKSGSLIILPFRDKTLQLWTEGSTYTKDFNQNILPNFSFSP